MAFRFIYWSGEKQADMVETVIKTKKPTTATQRMLRLPFNLGKHEDMIPHQLCLDECFQNEGAVLTSPIHVSNWKGGDSSVKQDKNFK